MEKRDNMPTWLVLVFLICFAPVGVFLLWHNKLYEKSFRIFLSVIFLFIFVAVGVDTLSNESFKHTNGNSNPKPFSVSSLDNRRIDKTKAERNQVSHGIKAQNEVSENEKDKNEIKKALSVLETLYEESESDYILANNLSEEEWIEKSANWNKELKYIQSKYYLNDDSNDQNRKSDDAGWRYLSLTAIDLFSLHEDYSSEILSGQSPDMDRREYLKQCVTDDFNSVKDYLN